MSNSLKDQYASTPLFGSNASAVEALYEQFLVDPGSVSDVWRNYFVSLGDPSTEIAHSAVREELLAGATLSNGRRTGSTHLVLTHMIPAIGAAAHGPYAIPGGPLDENDFASAAREGGFEGEIHVGRDLLTLRLP